MKSFVTYLLLLLSLNGLSQTTISNVKNVTFTIPKGFSINVDNIPRTYKKCKAVENDYAPEDQNLITNFTVISIEAPKNKPNETDEEQVKQFLNAYRASFKYDKNAKITHTPVTKNMLVGKQGFSYIKTDKDLENFYTKQEVVAIKHKSQILIFCFSDFLKDYAKSIVLWEQFKKSITLK
jgi:hypothetical protein